MHEKTYIKIIIFFSIVTFQLATLAFVINNRHKFDLNFAPSEDPNVSGVSIQATVDNSSDEGMTNKDTIEPEENTKSQSPGSFKWEGNTLTTGLYPSPDKPMLSFVAVGDISFSREVERVVKRHKDIYFPLRETQHILSNADFTYANLESPITAGEEIPDGSMIFRANPGTEVALKWAGIDIVNLANNHTMNFGHKGLIDTMNYLNAAGINQVGAGKNLGEALTPLVIEKDGMKIALSSYEAMDIVPPGYEAGGSSPGIAFMRTELMKDAVKKAKDRADLVLVAMHAGQEYVPEGNDLQISFAHAAIDAGAEMVIGDHPHVVQNAEIYNNKVIIYSLGNFVMDQMWSEDTRRGLIMKAYFTKEGLESVEFIPIQIEAYSQPNPVSGEPGEIILKRLQLSDTI